MRNVQNQDQANTFVIGTTSSLRNWSTTYAPASDRYPWFSTRQGRPNMQGQNVRCQNFPHLGLKAP